MDPLAVDGVQLEFDSLMRLQHLGGAMRAGRAPKPGRVSLEHNFARHYDLPASGTLAVAGGRRVRYSGQALSPEYFIVTAPGADFGAEAAFECF